MKEKLIKLLRGDRVDVFSYILLAFVGILVVFFIFLRYEVIKLPDTICMVMSCVAVVFFFLFLIMDRLLEVSDEVIRKNKFIFIFLSDVRITSAIVLVIMLCALGLVLPAELIKTTLGAVICIVILLPVTGFISISISNYFSNKLEK